MSYSSWFIAENHCHVSLWKITIGWQRGLKIPRKNWDEHEHCIRFHSDEVAIISEWLVLLLAMHFREATSKLTSVDRIMYKAKLVAIFLEKCPRAPWGDSHRMWQTTTLPSADEEFLLERGWSGSAMQELQGHDYIYISGRVMADVCVDNTGPCLVNNSMLALPY